MNSKVSLVLRLLLALIMIVFGLNKFANFLPAPEVEGAAGGYFTALMDSNTLTVVGLLEVITGLSFLTNRYVALALIINAPLAFNAVLFHASLDPANIGPAALWLIIVIVLLFANKEKYQPLLQK